MTYPLCRHIKTNGIACESPALTGQTYCFFHTTLLGRHKNFRFTPATCHYCTPGIYLELTALEDHESIQLSISMVVNALASGMMNERVAALTLKGLELAIRNVRHLKAAANTAKLVQSAETTEDGLNLTHLPPSEAPQATETPCEAPEASESAEAPSEAPEASGASEVREASDAPSPSPSQSPSQAIEAAAKPSSAAVAGILDGIEASIPRTPSSPRRRCIRAATHRPTCEGNGAGRGSRRQPGEQRYRSRLFGAVPAQRHLPSEGERKTALNRTWSLSQEERSTVG